MAKLLSSEFDNVMHDNKSYFPFIMFMSHTFIQSFADTKTDIFHLTKQLPTLYIFQYDILNTDLQF